MHDSDEASIWKRRLANAKIPNTANCLGLQYRGDNMKEVNLYRGDAPKQLQDTHSPRMGDEDQHAQCSGTPKSARPALSRVLLGLLRAPVLWKS